MEISNTTYNDSYPNFLISLKGVAKMLALSLPTIHRIRGLDPTFPRPIVVGASTIRFVEAEVKAWAEGRRR